MPRPHRRIEAGIIYHVLNRGNGRRDLFAKDADFAAFIKVLREALEPLPGRSAVVLPDEQPLAPAAAAAERFGPSQMMGWLTVTHARRHHAHYPNPGSGHLYQGRFKSFPVQSDEHFLTVARYIHANPLRAELVKDARDWPWSDLRGQRDAAARGLAGRSPAQLGDAGEPADEAHGSCRRRAQHRPRHAVGLTNVDTAHREQTGPGQHPQATWPTEKAGDGVEPAVSQSDSSDGRRRQVNHGDPVKSPGDPLTCSDFNVRYQTVHAATGSYQEIDWLPWIKMRLT